MKYLLLMTLAANILFGGGNIYPANESQATAFEVEKVATLPKVLNTTPTIDNIAKFSFVGISISSSKIDFTNTTSQKDATLGLRYGLQSTSWRTFADVSFDWRDNLSVSLETDKLFTAYKIETLTVAPYLGVSIGYFDHKLSDDNHSMYGLHAGVLFNLSDKVDLDFGMSLKCKRNLDNIDKYTGATLSLHYFF